MHYDKTKACGQCPFRKTSAKGYVGPYQSPRDLVNAAKHGDFACHTSPGDGNTKDVGAQACYGAAVMMNKSAHSSRDPVTRGWQEKCGKDDPKIMDQWQTIERHTK